MKIEQFPPIPSWQPKIIQPIDKIIDRMVYYTNGMDALNPIVIKIVRSKNI